MPYARRAFLSVLGAAATALGLSRLPVVRGTPSEFRVTPPAKRVSWQECAVCGGVFIVWANAEQDAHDWDYVNYQNFTRRNGEYVKPTDPANCEDCGSWHWEAQGFQLSRRRWGDALPTESVA